MIEPITSEPDNLPASFPGVTRRLGMMDFWMIVLMIIWGSNFVILKSALETLPPMVINGLRFSVGALALGVIFTVNGNKLILPRREWPILIWLAFQGNTLFQLLFLTALHLTTVANSALILTAMPIWVVVFNAWRGHERFGKRATLGVFMAIVGVTLVIVGGQQVDIGGATLVGDLLTLLASLLFSATTLLSHKPYLRNPTPPLAFWGVLWGAAFQLVFAVPDLAHQDWSAFSLPLVLAICYSGVVSIGVGNVIWNHGVKVLGTGRPSIYTYLEPVIAGIAAAIVLHEPLTPYLLVGAAAVLVGVVLAQSG